MSSYNINTESEVNIIPVVVVEDEVDITDEVDTVEKPIDGWHIFGTECPKEEIVFLCQVIILYTVIVVSIYNLTVAYARRPNPLDGFVEQLVGLSTTQSIA